MCLQFFKANYFMVYMNRNFAFFIFFSIIPLSIVILIYNNYNDITDIFENYKYIPFYKISNNISQNDMNRICLEQSLIVFLLISIVIGIKRNHDFVTKEKNNYYNLNDVVLFNQNIKTKAIILNVAIYILLAFALNVLKEYFDYFGEIPFSYYLLIEIIIYLILGQGFFGIGIKGMIKPNVNEGIELEDYRDMELSNGSTPGIENGEEGRI